MQTFGWKNIWSMLWISQTDFNSEGRYTGNRQHVPSAYSARAINSIKNYANKQLRYNLCK
ncbi:hypothetical protein RhiirA5_444385 [Rhizophagus irregularis]|uniref:Uncharacterized protein n=1 Tax=Rhizophagus irregularis TaxID=588596 RepID=A0A2I1ERE6_9GLOM|nr:hypothetical protein RhiirA5_444385 [Rhizophagus irregularis]PKC51285.1 hypothetical protein RhiirA1_484095 [Rhizophagus irregularis]PKY24718.1 hypothetical protein RhiirB3_439392 [Rhizophagus irregularis]